MTDQQPSMIGYASREYAAALAEFGQPLQLGHAGGWLLKRPLAAEEGFDACGCYPLFSCQEWSRLPRDLGELDSKVVAVAVVADPLTLPAEACLVECFPDVCRPYKEHFLIDLTRPLATFVVAHHQRNARQAARKLSVERLESPLTHLDDWCGLYEQLVERHGIQGIAAFSRQSFARQFDVPGMRAYVARNQGQIVGMVLWMVDAGRAHYHLAAYSDLGYELKASFALFWQSLESLAADGVELVGLGSGAGVYAADEGLSRFKRGWSNEARPAWFCGRVNNRQKYGELVAQTGTQDSVYFPAYRTPAALVAA